MTNTTTRRLDAWTATELMADRNWIARLDDAARDALADEVRRLHVPGKPVMAYAPGEADLGAAREPIARAFASAKTGRGVGLVKNLPREGLSEDAFALMTWLIGLEQGVPRPQGKESQYLSAVRNAGGAYRTPTGRGYNSNAELDYHIDGADLVALTCYNIARSGGLSTCVSTRTVYEALKNDHPDMLALLYETYTYNRQGEEAPGEAPTFETPIFMEEGDRIFVRWIRNRVEAAQTRPEVPKLDARHRQALDVLDEVIRRPEHVAAMMLEPGDMQILSNHRCLHSRTEFEDFEEPERKRLLYRLWLSPPGAEALPPQLAAWYGATADGAVRGGIQGQRYDDSCRAFDARLAAYHGMAPPQAQAA